MRYVLFIVIMLIIGMGVLAVTPVAAHPGPTYSDGGHSCRTNCPSWGLEYGEYHYHNGGDYEDSYYNQGSQAGLEHADENSTYIYSRAESQGAQDGESDGESGGSEDASPDSSDACSGVDFQDDSTPQDYYDGFMDSYSDACGDAYDERYSSAYATAYAIGEEIYIESNSDTRSDESGSSAEQGNWLLDLLPYVLLALLFIIIANWESIRDWWKGY